MEVYFLENLSAEKNQNVKLRIGQSFGGMKCCLCQKGLMLQFSTAFDIAYCGFSSPLS